MKQTFDVTGMTCAACSARVEKVTNNTPGVKHAVVNLLKNSMEVEYDGTPETAAAISAMPFTRTSFSRARIKLSLSAAMCCRCISRAIL